MKAAIMLHYFVMNNSAAQQEHSAHQLCKNRLDIEGRENCNILYCPCLV